MILSIQREVGHVLMENLGLSGTTFKEGSTVHVWHDGTCSFAGPYVQSTFTSAPQSAWVWVNTLPSWCRLPWKRKPQKTCRDFYLLSQLFDVLLRFHRNGHSWIVPTSSDGISTSKELIACIRYRSETSTPKFHESPASNFNSANLM